MNEANSTEQEGSEKAAIFAPDTSAFYNNEESVTKEKERQKVARYLMVLNSCLKDFSRISVFIELYPELSAIKTQDQLLGELEIFDSRFEALKVDRLQADSLDFPNA